MSNFRTGFKTNFLPFKYWTSLVFGSHCKLLKFATFEETNHFFGGGVGGEVLSMHVTSFSNDPFKVTK